MMRTSPEPAGPDGFVRAVRVVFVAALVFTIVMALLPKPPKLAIDQLGDKFEHILAFTTLSILAWLAFPRARLLRIGGALSLLGAMIEVLQAIPALHRDCDVRDWIGDSLAIFVVLSLVALRRRGRKRDQ